MRLRGQYTMVIGGLVCASLLVLGAALLAEQRRYAEEISSVASSNLSDTLERQIEKHGISLASALAERLVTPLYHNDYRQISHEAAELRSYPDVLTASVVDGRGMLIRESGVPPDGDDSRQAVPWVREALETGKPSSRRDGRTLRVAAPAVLENHVIGAALVDLAMDGIRSDIQLEQARLDGLIRSQSTAFSLTGIALGIVLVTVSVLSAIGVAGGLSRPVVAFASRARRIGRGELVQSDALERRDEIGDLSRAFDEMAATLRTTTVSKDYFDNVLRSMADMLIATDAEGRVVTANPRCLEELGASESELHGKLIETLLPDLRRAPVGLPRYSDSPRTFELCRPDGGHIPVRVSAAPLREEGGVPTGYVFVMENVTDRLAAERQIERSLVEKEILLREIHHRVKNNLQIISSMLSLQGDRSRDDDTREIFHESEVRIRAMALVHEQLYRSGDLAHVDLARYLDTLAQQVIRYLGHGECHVDVHVDESVREVSVDQAIPIGLIVNELIANSVKHGFTGQPKGLITVRLSGNALARRLLVTDNGSGFPADLDIETSDSLGLKLVQALTEQLGGHLTMATDGGAKCIVDLPALAQTAGVDDVSIEDSEAVAPGRPRKAVAS
ncbi:MAG TPA: histidine kinase dimerization/phosphoacceptor domain -containing protein [Candidatus Limnocylindrales bacterium]|nr:histidine kinase dimerization/phosphoacceptor domain -containing protein [Candidatus Limnocylindrales bacterium]